jgi:hypothetical protein
MEERRVASLTSQTRIPLPLLRKMESALKGVEGERSYLSEGDTK